MNSINNELKQPNILLRLASSLPVLGNALAIVIELTETGIAQYGYILGLLRGMLTGLVLAAVLIVTSEVLVAVFDVGRYYIAMHYLESIKAQIRADMLHEDEETELQKLREIESQRRSRRAGKGDQ